MKIFIRILIAIITFGIWLGFSAPIKAASIEEDFYQCMGTSLAEYMNAVIDAKNRGEIPANVHLLSPAFNVC